jgi:uncharacterized protein (UPF0332 family)
MSELIIRARASISTARMVLEAGDTNSVINRACCGMFDLARAALLAVDPKLVAAKTHATIISRFSRHMVKDRSFPIELGKALRRAHDLRLVTDYSQSIARETTPGRLSRQPSNSWPQ